MLTHTLNLCSIYGIFHCFYIMWSLQPGVLTTHSHVTTQNVSPNWTQSATSSQTAQTDLMKLIVVNDAWDLKFHYWPIKLHYSVVFQILWLKKKSVCFKQTAAKYTDTGRSYCYFEVAAVPVRKAFNFSPLSHHPSFSLSLWYTSCHGESNRRWWGCSARGAAMAGQSEVVWPSHLRSHHYQRTLACQRSTLLWKVGSNDFQVTCELFINLPKSVITQRQGKHLVNRKLNPNIIVLLSFLHV